jgi:hypothetical protein
MKAKILVPVPIDLLETYPKRFTSIDSYFSYQESLNCPKQTALGRILLILKLLEITDQSVYGNYIFLST